MATAMTYEVSIGLIGLVISLVFLWSLDYERDWERRKMMYKLAGALTLFSVSLVTQVVGATWNVIEIRGIKFPPLNTVFEAFVIGFLVSGIWDVWKENL